MNIYVWKKVLICIYVSVDFLPLTDYNSEQNPCFNADQNMLSVSTHTVLSYLSMSPMCSSEAAEL